MISFVVALCCIVILAVILLFFLGDDDWPDDRHLDPPRGGLERTVVEELAKHPPRLLKYVSCDPAAFGRDAGRLVRSGLELQQVVLLDLFPNTHHFETVATFKTNTDRSA